MVGRITERHLPMAERCYPGIRRFYAGMVETPATFLQLVWAFEAHRARPSAAAAGPRTRAGR
jgi:hypothetical protein